METIFDYNPTKEELRRLGRQIPKDKYESIVSDNSRYRDLAALFHIRGKEWKMRKYINKVTNIDMRNSFFRTIYHP
ncbi:MAG: hypothetical protein II063_08040 [Prevotella sp.]|jgi:hypothetical protein|nr:hypothetical protein [Prevotella sp.]